MVGIVDSRAMVPMRGDCQSLTAACVSDKPQAWQLSGASRTVWFGSSVSDRDDPDSPGCLPGLRPDRARDDRLRAGFLAHGASDDGGREEFDESAPRRRSNSATRSVNAATIRFNSAFSAMSSS
jgi:hypothetical protein